MRIRRCWYNSNMLLVRFYDDVSQTDESGPRTVFAMATSRFVM